VKLSEVKNNKMKYSWNDNVEFYMQPVLLEKSNNTRNLTVSWETAYCKETPSFSIAKKSLIDACLVTYECQIQPLQISIFLCYKWLAELFCPH
jgi:hypothetical protein